MEEAKKQRGGRREGAGRKPTGKALTTVSFRMERQLIEAIDEAASKSGRTRTDLITEAILSYIPELRPVRK